MTSIFRNIKSNISSSIVVFLVALPLCLGIALACGMPLFSGLIAGMIGGIVVGFFSNSSLSVTGPAAGLTSIVIASKLELQTNEAFFLAVLLAGVFQILFSFLRAGIIAYYIPSNVIKGMLAAIGIIIVMKQIPHALGWDRDAEGDFSFLQIDGENTITELWNSLWHIDLGVFLIAAIGLLIISFWDKVQIKYLRSIPSGLMVVVVGIVLNLIFARFIPALAINAEHLVSLPEFSNTTEFFQLFTLPDFTQLKNPQIYIIAFTIAAVASLETLLCIEAIDKIDPLKRTTDTTRELWAQGVGNISSGLLGGLPITSVVVRSAANLNAGATSKMSTILHGLLLFICFISIPNIIELIPYGSLAAILIYTGYKLASPKIFKEIYRQGKWQFIPYIVTIVAIYFIDLLAGVLIGLFIGVLFILIRNVKSPSLVADKSIKDDSVMKLELNSELTFLNKAQTILTLSEIPENKQLILDARKTMHIDYDVLEEIKEFINVVAPSKNIGITTIGFRSKFGIKNSESIYDEILGKDVDESKLEIHAKELQEKITPSKALDLMKEGNRRFVTNLKINRDILEQVNVTSEGQYPFAVVLSCIDSRTSAEIIFDKGMGDLFSIRIAGNVVNQDILGSMEFACKVAGSKLIVVLGHTKCGAIKGACDHVEMGNLTGLIHKIQPAIDLEKQTLEHRNSANGDFVENVSELNVHNSVKFILDNSPIIKEMVEKGEIGLVGGMYHLDTGLVDFYEEDMHIKTS